MQYRRSLLLPLMAGVALISLVVFHPAAAQAADRRLPAVCAQAPQIVSDAKTHQAVVTGQDATYRSWMVKLWCPARDARKDPAGLTRYVVALTAVTQCQQVKTGVSYSLTYTDTDGGVDHVTALTGITVLTASEKRLFTTPVATFRLCPGQVHLVESPWRDANAAHIGIFSLALPNGGFILTEY